MNIDYNIRTEFQEAVAAFLTKIAAASPFETVKDKSIAARIER